MAERLEQLVQEAVRLNRTNRIIVVSRPSFGTRAPMFVDANRPYTPEILPPEIEHKFEPPVVLKGRLWASNTRIGADFFVGKNLPQPRTIATPLVNFYCHEFYWSLSPKQFSLTDDDVAQIGKVTFNWKAKCTTIDDPLPEILLMLRETRTTRMEQGRLRVYYCYSFADPIRHCINEFFPHDVTRVTLYNHIVFPLYSWKEGIKYVWRVIEIENVPTALMLIHSTLPLVIYSSDHKDAILETNPKHSDVLLLEHPLPQGRIVD